MAHNVAMPRKEVRGRKAHGRAALESDPGPRAFLDQVFLRIQPQMQEAAPDVNTPADKPAPTQGDPIIMLIAENPEMNASTFFNLLKSKGFVISAPSAANAMMNEALEGSSKKEADDASTNVAALRAGVKKESKGHTFRVRTFLESAVQVDPKKGMNTRYKVVLLEEGMGNFGAAAYYSKEALESGIPVFEGKKIYADHPAESEATERPERSVRDVLGHFENVHVAESKNGQHWLCGDLVVMGGQSYQWARELMEHAVAYAKKFPDKEFVGLSINASGDSEELPIQEAMKKGIPTGAMPKIQEAQKQGIDTLTYVSKFNEAVSCDLVTEAGAGGKILDLIEGAKMGKKNVKESKSEGIENKESKENKENKEADATTGDDQAGGGHADAAQDAELIKKMIAKHGNMEPSDEECSIVKEAYEAHKEMGLKDAEAESAAVGYLKASKHMAAKKAAQEAAAQQSESTESAGSESSADDKKDGADKSMENKESSVKESAQKSEIEKLREENTRLKGEQAALKESERKTQVSAHIEKVCKESKLHNTVTTDFKKLVEGAKSIEEVEKTWKVFHEGYRARKQATEGELDFDGMVVDVEKTSLTESSKGAGIDFDACVKD